MALYNLSAEQSVLGSILIEPESILVANQFNLCVNDFYHPQHQIIYNCIKKMHDSGDAIDFVTLKNKSFRKSRRSLIFYITHKCSPHDKKHRLSH